MSAGASGMLLYAGIGLGAFALVPAVLFLASKRKPEPAREDEQESTLGDPINVYFGSQTGTAESFAQIIAAEGRRHGFTMNVVDLEDFNSEELLSTGKAIFLMATYGDGEPTDNAAGFAAWLSNKDESLPPDFLATVNFTVFGLGNTQYEHYNSMGKSTDAGLEKLGAKEMYPYGEGDDDADLEADFEAWKEGLWKAVEEKFGRQMNLDGLAEACSTPISIRYLNEDEVSTVSPSTESQAASSSRFYWQGKDAKVVVNRELRAQKEDLGSTRHIEIDLEGSGVTYSTADNLAVLPLNDRLVVDKLCARLGYDPQAMFVLEHGDGHKPVFPTPCSVRDALSRFMDIMSIPRRTLLEQLVPYVEDRDEQEKLRQLVAKEGREEYHRVIEDPGMTLAEVMLDSFPSLRMPLEHFLHIVPHLHPRYYTISSSSKVSPSRVHITVAVLEQRRGENRVYRGVCSNFLRKLEPCPTNGGAGKLASAGSVSCTNGTTTLCQVFVRESSFRLPADPATPILMIGPGTGLAPMRALLQERSWRRAQGDNVGRSVLYFGCRRRDEDYIYRDELEAYEADGTLGRLRLAFSREGASKVYVQHLLRDDAAEVWELLKEGAYVYVCGGTQMGKDVHDELVRVVGEGGSMSAEKSLEYMQSMQSSGRYVQELWS